MTDKAPDSPPQDISQIAKAARTKQFKNLLEKIRKGSITPGEMKVFAQLEEALTDQQTPQSGGRVLYSTGEVAKAVKRTERTVRDWIKSGMPVLPGGGFDLDQIKKWRRDRKKPQTEEEQTAEYWQTQYKKHKAKLSEIELKVKKGELLPRAEVMTSFREMQTYVKKHLLLIPRIAPDRMVGLSIQDQKALLQELVETILTNMARGEGAHTIQRIIKG